MQEAGQVAGATTAAQGGSASAVGVAAAAVIASSVSKGIGMDTPLLCPGLGAGSKVVFEDGSSDEAAGDKLASPADLEVPSEPPLEVRQWFGRSVYLQVFVRRF